jgi:hypothetical protein
LKIGDWSIEDWGLAILLPGRAPINRSSVVNGIVHCPSVPLNQSQSQIANQPIVNLQSAVVNA